MGIKNYFVNWTWFLYAAGIQSGAVKQGTDRIKDSPDLFTKFNKHLDLLSGYVNMNKFPVMLLLMLGIILFYLVFYYSTDFFKKKVKIKKEIKNVSCMSVLFLSSVMLSYFIWWIFITPTDRAWHRRIMPGIVLYGICFVILLFMFYEIARERWKDKKSFKIAANVTGLVVFAVAVFLFVNSENSRISFSDTKEKKEITEAGQYMRIFPWDAEFFGFSWWQAPNLSFTSGRTFKDFLLSEEMKTTGEKYEKYLVLDRPAMENQKLCIERILSDFIYELVFVNDEVRIYKLTQRQKQSEYLEECN